MVKPSASRVPRRQRHVHCPESNTCRRWDSTRLNNRNDITVDARCSAIRGYTQTDLATVFCGLERRSTTPSMSSSSSTSGNSRRFGSRRGHRSFPLYGSLESPDCPSSRVSILIKEWFINATKHGGRPKGPVGQNFPVFGGTPLILPLECHGELWISRTELAYLSKLISRRQVPITKSSDTRVDTQCGGIFCGGSQSTDNRIGVGLSHADRRPRCA